MDIIVTKEKKNILRESWHDTENFLRNFASIFAVARQVITPYGYEVIGEYREIQKEIHNEVAQIDRRLNKFVVEDMAKISLNELEKYMVKEASIDTLKELFSRHEQLRGVLKKYDNLEFHFKHEDKIYPEKQNERYLRLEDKFRKIKREGF